MVFYHKIMFAMVSHCGKMYLLTFGPFLVRRFKAICITMLIKHKNNIRQLNRNIRVRKSLPFKNEIKSGNLLLC